MDTFETNYPIEFNLRVETDLVRTKSHNVNYGEMNCSTTRFPQHLLDQNRQPYRDETHNKAEYELL